MSAAEQGAMGEHFAYLQNLMHRGKVLMAGPVMEPVWGLIALEVADEAEARAIMDAEPSVTAGVHSYTLHPFSASLLVGRELHARSAAGRVIEKEVVLDAPRAEVWRTWTSEEGIATFFARNNRVELRVGGPFEMLFDMGQPEGLRGSEGCRILAFLPEEMLAFSWNAPPAHPEIRQLRTQVVLQFSDAGEGKTHLRLVNHGYGAGEKWDPVYDYFDNAWGFVLENLRKRFVDGPRWG